MSDFERGSIAGAIMPKAKPRPVPAYAAESSEDRRDRKSARAYRIGSVLFAAGPILGLIVSALLAPSPDRGDVLSSLHRMETAISWMVAAGLAICHEVVISRRESRHLAKAKE